MALTNFRIEDKRTIRLAQAESVPRVMVIAGPNGVGKSTLLYALREGGAGTDPNTRFLYQGPHRVLRRTSVRRSWLGGAFRGLADLLTGNDVNGYEGLSFGNTARSPENVDEAGSTSKHTLGKIENRHQTLLASTVYRLKASGASLDISMLPDVYEPLRKLTEYLLPHLRFLEVDFTNEDNILCKWERTDSSGTVLVDIDDLSSGEKAIVVLFLPLLEGQIQGRLDSLLNFGSTNQAVPAPEHDRVVLIDEPELHLHPDLQAKILTYMRNVSHESNTQFVITTHSPTILDQAYDTELFVLEASDPGQTTNQLRQIATNAERLEALKQLAGSAYFLTTGRVVVCIEGEFDADPERPTDARLLGILYPRATAVTLVPTKAKGNVITTVTRLREHVPENIFRIRIRGLVDADQTDEATPGIEVLPVSMIENFLLDAEAIYSYLMSVGVDSFKSAAEVRTELKTIALEMRNKEIELRIRRKIKPRMFRIGGANVIEIQADHAKKLSEFQSMLPGDTELEEIVRETTAAVDSLIATDTELDHFRGKVLLEIFHDRHLVPLSIGYNVMCIEVAKLIAVRGTVANRLDPVFERLLA
jgi:hypothetical protein